MKKRSITFPEALAKMGACKNVRARATGHDVNWARQHLALRHWNWLRWKHQIQSIMTEQERSDLRCLCFACDKTHVKRRQVRAFLRTVGFKKGKFVRLKRPVRGRIRG